VFIGAYTAYCGHYGVITAALDIFITSGAVAHPYVNSH